MSEIYLNPKIDSDFKKHLFDSINKSGDHKLIYLASSGTESNKMGYIKFVGLSKKAISDSALSVINKFNITKSDRAICVLPRFHVGGLAMQYRADLSGGEIFYLNSKWSASDFVKKCVEYKITYTSLVPTQIYDLVQSNLKSPEEIRFILVGGGYLSQDLLQRALKLGWPLALSYGMTETAATIASTDILTTQIESIDMSLHPHIDMESKNGDIYIKSSALFEHYLLVGELETQKIDPKIDGWFKIDDKLLLKERSIRVLGRENEIVKIKGETVSICGIENKLKDLALKLNLNFDFYLVPIPHPRDGYSLKLVCTQAEFKKMADVFNKDALAFERISSVEIVKEIKKTDLGKIIKN